MSLLHQSVAQAGEVVVASLCSLCMMDAKGIDRHTTDCPQGAFRQP